jgi:hypothetical protein
MSDQIDEIGIELAKYNLTLVLEWIKLADSKVKFLLSITLAVAGVSLTEVSPATKVVANYFETAQWGVATFLIVVHIAFYLMIFYTLCTLISVVRPRLVPKSERHSWFFFQSMALLSPEDFRSLCETLDTPKKLAHLTEQIYNNAVVARKKYERINHAISSLVAMLLIGIIAIVPVLAISALLVKPN